MDDDFTRVYCSFAAISTDISRHALLRYISTICPPFSISFLKANLSAANYARACNFCYIFAIAYLFCFEEGC